MDKILEITRDAPVPFTFSAPFWEGTRDKRLLLQFCRQTNRPQFYPRPTSIFSGRRDLEWREVSGQGELFTFTIANMGAGQLRGYEPYAIANVLLDVGVNIIGNLVHCPIEEIRIGMRVKPHWAPTADGKHLLMFEPDRARP